MITNGFVSFEESRKLAEYENRKVSVNFNIGGDEGVDETTAHRAAALARDLVHEFLGYKPTPAVTDTAKPAAKAKPGPKPKAKAPDPDPADVGALEGGSAISTGEARVDPANPDPADFGADFAAEPEEVTDKALTEATTRKNAELIKSLGSEGTGKIRKLIGTFVTHPKGLTDIPAASRSEYLKKLAALAA